MLKVCDTTTLSEAAMYRDGRSHSERVKFLNAYSKHVAISSWIFTEVHKAGGSSGSKQTYTYCVFHLNCETALSWLVCQVPQRHHLEITIISKYKGTASVIPPEAASRRKRRNKKEISSLFSCHFYWLPRGYITAADAECHVASDWKPQWKTWTGMELEGNGADSLSEESDAEPQMLGANLKILISHTLQHIHVSWYCFQIFIAYTTNSLSFLEFTMDIILNLFMSLLSSTFLRFFFPGENVKIHHF